MTKEQFLKRCETAWDMGIVSPDSLYILRDNHEAMTRLVGNQVCNFSSMLERELERTSLEGHLANDKRGYSMTQFTYLLCHPCQKCAVDKNAWHTRYGFCEHNSKIKREVITINPPKK